MHSNRDSFDLGDGDGTPIPEDFDRRVDRRVGAAAAWMLLDRDAWV
jgi:hypothetical protein